MDHFDGDVDNFGETYENFGIGQVNNEWVKLMEWVFSKGLRLINNCFKERKSLLITFRLSQVETGIVNNSNGIRVKDDKVIPGKEVVSQHFL